MAIVLQTGHLNSGWLASLNAILEQFTALYSGVDALENQVINSGWVVASQELISRINEVLVAETLDELPELTNSDINNGVNSFLLTLAANLSAIVGVTILAPTSIVFPQDANTNGTITLLEQGVAGSDILFKVNLPTDTVADDSLVVSVTSSTVGTLTFANLDITPANITAGFVTLSAKQVGTLTGTTVVGTVRIKRASILSATTAFTIIIQNVLLNPN